jgi:hypothetical protein
MEFRIAGTFTDSFAKLSGDEQKAVKTAAFDLQLNPACTPPRTPPRRPSPLRALYAFPLPFLCAFLSVSASLRGIPIPC